MNNSTQLLQNDIKNFILSDNISNAYREHLLEEILEDYFSTLDDDMIQEYEDYMFPIMEVMSNEEGEFADPKVISSQELEGDISTVKDSDYAECVDSLVDRLKSTK